MELKNLDWSDYYQYAEPWAERHWKEVVSKHMEGHPIDMKVVCDFACGNGRIAQFFMGVAEQLICCDISESAVEFSRERLSGLGGGTRVTAVTNTEERIPIDDGTVTFVYSCDALVHFDKTGLEPVLGEFSRILVKGGYGLVHHSNFASFVTRALALWRLGALTARGKNSDWIEPHFAFLNASKRKWSENPHGRAFMGKKLFRQLCQDHGLAVVEQTVTNWGYRRLDCVSVFVKD